jgi:hypothetical protein
MMGVRKSVGYIAHLVLLNASTWRAFGGTMSWHSRALSFVIVAMTVAPSLALAQNGAFRGCADKTLEKTTENCLRVIGSSQNQTEIASALAVLCRTSVETPSFSADAASYCDRALEIDPELPSGLAARRTFKLWASMSANDPTEKARLAAEAKADADKLAAVCARRIQNLDRRIPSDSDTEQFSFCAQQRR